MGNGTFQNAADVLAWRRRHRIWQKIVGALCCVVALCITYALILPAITLEKTLICEKQEHTHSDGCYTQVTAVSRQELVCTEEHEHTEECFKTVEEPVDPQALTCGLEETESHSHGALCYGAWELTCGLEEHTHGQECYDPPLPAEAAVSADPMELNNYISGAILQYRTSSAEEWQQVDKSKPLPGNAELKLTISYDNIRVDDLNKAGRQVTYTLPELLRSPTGTGQINDQDDQRMGTMTVENSVVTLTFDEVWLENHHSTTENDVIGGSFHVQSQIDLGMASEKPSMQITVGDVIIDLSFEPNIIAHYADVSIVKDDPVAIQEDGADYLEYTLTVTAGEDGAVDVVVKDLFEDQSQIRGYVGISESGAGPVETVSPEGQAGRYSMDGNTMVWTVESMAPKEVRTLTYRVRMQEGYLGGKKQPTVVNKAQLYCGEYWRAEDKGTFEPNAAATLTKVPGDYTPTPDGGGIITYTIWVHADEGNNHNLINVRIWDALDGSISGWNTTNKDYLPFVSYVEDSFLLYPGGEQGQNGDSGLKPEEGVRISPDYQKNRDGTDNKHFISCSVGTLIPGESKTLIYSVKVAPGIFPKAGNNGIKVNNRAQIHAGDSETNNETAMQGCSINAAVDQKVWSSKHAGIEQKADAAIPIDGRVYGADGSLMDSPPREFAVPAGSFLYQIDVNSAGDWDVSRVAMKDNLDDRLGDNVKYIGYARVQAYDVDDAGNQTLADTVWLAVDGRSDFQFTPRDVGLREKQAYQVTYYTHVTVPAGASVITVTNDFTMTGDVGFGSVYYKGLGAKASVTNTIQGTNSFAVSKHSWYYEPPKVSTGEYARGAIYWYIQVDGTEIPANTCLKDVTSYNTQIIYDSSLVGLYTGNLEGRAVSDYDDLEDLLASCKLTPLDASGYSFTITPYEPNVVKYPDMTVQLTNSVPLGNGTSLFLIIKMEPLGDPATLSGTEYHTYKNGVESSYNGSNWVPWGDPQTKVLYGSNGISKTMEKVSSWNGTEETVISPAEGTASPDALTDQEKGTYVFWKVQLNYPGNLHGGYWVEEIIPDGMKLAYVECTGVGSGYKTAKPSCVQKSPGDGWTESQRAGELTTYYYTNGQAARWYVDGLQPSGNNCTVDFLVVCRVTDGDVLMGGVEKTFQNQVKLLRESGKLIDSSSSPVTVQCHTLSKQGTYSPELDSTRFPFVINLNPLGEDLVPEAETLSLVDTLSDTLKLDLSSIQVVETGTNTVLTNWRSSVKGQTLTLTLPDQIPLTVTYSAWINARPGDRIDISNDAHWEGYPTPSGGAVDEQNFEFNISGSAGTSESPSVRITKLDESDLSKALSDAWFTLTKAELVDGAIHETSESWTGYTDGTGELTFGKKTGQTMEYNTVYCLRETQAPPEYVLDSTPHYFVIAKALADGTYPTFPSNVQVRYTGSEYSYQALNRMGQITVQKTFSDPGGNAYGPVPGTYTFGLYDGIDGSGRPVDPALDTLTITYSDTDTEFKTAVFRNLPVGKSYYVFELDEHGDPIPDGGILSNRFVVDCRYPEGADCAALTSANGDQTVTVNNEARLPELPETGGIGTTVFYLAGSILLAGAALLLTKKRFRFGT